MEFKIVEYWDLVKDSEGFIYPMHDEVGPFEEMELDPDYDTYEALASTDQLACFGAFDRDELVGFGVFIVVDHHYYTGVSVGQSDLIYMAPAYRGKDSMDFIKFCEEKLYSDFGVQGISISMHTKRDFSGMLQELNYKKTAIVCSKYVGDY